jgi:hypothetical protein
MEFIRLSGGFHATWRRLIFELACGNRDSDVNTANSHVRQVSATSASVSRWFAATLLNHAGQQELQVLCSDKTFYGTLLTIFDRLALYRCDRSASSHRSEVGEQFSRLIRQCCVEIFTRNGAIDEIIRGFVDSCRLRVRCLPARIFILVGLAQFVADYSHSSLLSAETVESLLALCSQQQNTWCVHSVLFIIIIQ